MKPALALPTEAKTAPSSEPGPPADAPTPEPTSTIGNDLADPKNFGLLPPKADLAQGSSKSEEFRIRLSQHLSFATRVLHTSGVPAAVWREWRAFEKAARQQLQDLARVRCDAYHR
jgi:hypothetical protein